MLRAIRLNKDVYEPLNVASRQGQQSSGALDALLAVVDRDDRWLVVDLGSVLIEGDVGLGAEVAVPEVKVVGANAVSAKDAGELYASLDPLGSVVSHGLIVSPRWRGNGARWSGGEGNKATLSLTTRFKRRPLFK